jgi:ABC-2 type transport system permease protein
MREALALMRAAWLTTLSYRLQMFVSVLGLVLSIVPLYFISRAVQPIMADSIRLEGRDYFAFLMVGLVTYLLIATVVNGLHGALSGEISSGALEAMLATPTRLWSIVAGEMGQGFSWTLVRATLMLVTAWFFGAHILWDRALTAVLIVGLILAAYLPVGIVAGAMILAFRTTAQGTTVVLSLSALLGGVYYPTSVIPSWLARVSDFIPLTYGLRALRRALIEGAPLTALAPDLLALAAFGIVLSLVSIVMFRWSVGHARRVGTLAQY